MGVELSSVLTSRRGPSFPFQLWYPVDIPQEEGWKKRPAYFSYQTSVYGKVREIQVCLLSSFTNIIVDHLRFCWSHLRTRTATSEVVVRILIWGPKTSGKWEMGRLVAQTLTWGKVCGYCRNFIVAEPAVPLPQGIQASRGNRSSGLSSFIRTRLYGFGVSGFRDM